MPLRPPAGFISAFYDPLKNPDAPTIGTATGGDASASVTFTPPTNVGGSAISSYSALSNPGQVVGTASSSPITVSGLTNGTAYTFAVWATNTYGPSAYSASTGSVTPAQPRAVFAGGSTGAPIYGDVNTIDYIIIATTGNATSFGSLASVSSDNAACASTTRGVIKVGNGGSSALNYITLASSGDATSFGNLSAAIGLLASANSSTRGLFGGGSSPWTSVINYITIATTGNSSSFGNINTELAGLAACSSSTRAVWAGGTNSSGTKQSTMYYSTIATLGNTTYFGGLSTNTDAMAGCSNSTRGIFAGGEDNSTGYLNTMRYITIASEGNSTSFGNLVANNNKLAGNANTTRAVFGGGQPSSSYTNAVNTMQYVTIASTGNATSFGVLTQARSQLAGCSASNGGTQ